MKMKRCACVAAAVLAVCTVAFLCRNQSVSEADGVVAKAISPSHAAASAASLPAAPSPVAALAAPTSNQTATVRGTKPYVLTCDRNIGKTLRLAAEALGVRTVSVLSRKSLLVEADSAAISRLRADGRFAVESEYLPSEKIAPALAAAIAGGANEVDVTFVTLSPSDRKLVQERIAAHGGEVLKGCLNDGDCFSARLPAGLVAELASCGDVRWMEPFVRPQLMNNNAVEPAAMNVRPIWLSDENLDGLSGAGQKISTSDSGIDTGDPETLHEDLRDRILEMKAAPDCDMFDSNGHGTHTAGSIVGEGKLSDGKIRGTAWGAQLYAWFCAKGGTRSIYTPETCKELFRGDEEGTAWDAYIHSASWGSDSAGVYTTQCATFDTYLWANPEFLPVVSAGNAGPAGLTVGSPAAAKNVLAVGATLNLSKGDPKKTASFSSRGPCADGRIKPDISAPGDAVTSTRSSLTEGVGPYTSMSGTSMACPLTAGAVALVREWLMRRTDEFAEEDGKRPTAALMKAIVTGGAKGSAAPGNEQGWGRVDLAETLFPSNRAVKLIDRIPFAEGDEFSWVVETKKDAPLDVQLAWVDAPGAANGAQNAPRLVNDLDLTVCSLGGSELYYGNGGDSADTLNNLESVRLESAAVDRYLVTVSCKDLPYDYTDGGAAALYIRGAFDPDEVTEHYTVRIVKSPAVTNFYTRVEKALAEAVDGETVEILDATYLRDSLVLTNDFALTVVSANADPRATPIARRKDADIFVAKGSLLFTNVVFQTGTSTPVRVAAPGVVKVAGTVVLDDIVSKVPGVLTDRPEGFEVSGRLESGITVECPGKSLAGDQFGVYSCSFEDATNSAPRLVSVSGVNRAGEAVTGGILKWKDGGTVDRKVAVGYIDGDEPIYYRTLDGLFDEHPDAANVVIMKSGGRLSKPRTLTGVRSISAAGEADEIVVIPDGAAGFTLGEGCHLTVAGITFRDYSGEGLFVVNGAGAKLTVTNSAFGNVEGSGKHSGAIAVLQGDAVVRDSVFDDCRATGEVFPWGAVKVRSYGGAVYLAAGCTLELDGGVIANCYANTYGGGIFAASGSCVRVRGDLTVKGNTAGSTRTGGDDIYLQTAESSLVLVGKLEGADAVGVRYGTEGSGFGNNCGDWLASVDGGVDHATAVSSAKAFFNDTYPETTKAVCTDDDKRLLWAERKLGDRYVAPEDVDAAVRVTKGGETRHYAEPAYAFDWIDADATVEVLRNAEFGADLVVTNGVKVTLTSTNGAPATMSRSGAFQIRVLPGASLVTANVVLDGGGSVADVGLVAVDGGTLDLQAGTTVTNVAGSRNRMSGAIYVGSRGTFAMTSGVEIVDCRNSYLNEGSKSGYGGGVLVEEHSTAKLLGGRIAGCRTRRGGGIFIGTQSTAYVGGDFTATNNTSTAGGRNDNLCLSDQSELFLVSPLVGSVGYNEGKMGDTNVFGKVDADYSGTEAEAQASAHRFTHDVTGDVGMAVSDGSGTLLVWGNALDADGKYDGHVLVEGSPAEIAVPTVSDFVYDGKEKTCLEDGIGYHVLSGNVATVVGTYTAVAKTRPGFAWTGGTTGETNLVWKIELAPYELRGVTFEDKTFEYDGTVKKLEIGGTLPQGLSVTYENNGRWQPGTNDVTACISGSVPNYTPDPFVTNLTAKLIIIDPEGKYHGEITPPGPVPPPVVPDPIGFKSITREEDGSSSLVVTNLKKGCNYRLIWTDDLAKGFVNTGAWEQATQDGPWSTNVVTEVEATFWKAEGKEGTITE